MSKEKHNYTGLWHSLEPRDGEKACVANKLLKTRAFNCLPLSVVIPHVVRFLGL